MSDRVTLYRVQVRYPDTAFYLAPERRGVWSVPRYGARNVKSTLPAARAALTKYRNEAAHVHADVRPEFRIVAISGEWTEIEETAP